MPLSTVDALEGQAEPERIGQSPWPVGFSATGPCSTPTDGSCGGPVTGAGAERAPRSTTIPTTRGATPPPSAGATPTIWVSGHHGSACCRCDCGAGSVGHLDAALLFPYHESVRCGLSTERRVGRHAAGRVGAGNDRLPGHRPGGLGAPAGAVRARHPRRPSSVGSGSRRVGAARVSVHPAGLAARLSHHPGERRRRPVATRHRDTDPRLHRRARALRCDAGGQRHRWRPVSVRRRRSSGGGRTARVDELRCVRQVPAVPVHRSSSHCCAVRAQSSFCSGRCS